MNFTGKSGSQFQVDKVYYITKCQLKPANKQFSKLPNDYEMTFSNDTCVQECSEADDIPAVKYEFKPISQIAEMPANESLGNCSNCKRTLHGPNEFI